MIDTSEKEEVTAMEAIKLTERYVVDENGVRQAVLMDIEEWNRVVRELEDLQDALAAMEARQDLEPTVTLDEYVRNRTECTK
jgi:alkyl hydroperoxide reductase subunit AhpC